VKHGYRDDETHQAECGQEHAFVCARCAEHTCWCCGSADPRVLFGFRLEECCDPCAIELEALSNAAHGEAS